MTIKQTEGQVFLSILSLALNWGWPPVTRRLRSPKPFSRPPFSSTIPSYWRKERSAKRTVRYAPTVEKALWEVAGQRVTTANVGDEVEAHVVIKTIREYIGSIMIKIRKDIAFQPERKDYYVETVPVNLIGGQEKEIELTFVPDQSRGNSLRGYFIEVDFLDSLTKWVMENSYPPRLRVT